MRAPAALQRGFTYLGLLFAVMVIGLMLTVAARVYRTTVQREREAQLLWVGHAYRMAISAYFAAGHHYPATLHDLLIDDRYPVPKHYLRQLYPDPMTGHADWTLILTPDQSGIQGVASTSQATPIKRDRFDLIDSTFKDSDCYCQWKFIFSPYRWMPGVGMSTPPAGAPPQTPGGGFITTPGSPTTAPGIPVPLPSNPTPAPSPAMPSPDPGSH
jgi:type II secretory pathway pseudopilin PulG